MKLPKLINMRGADPQKFTYVNELPVYWRNDCEGTVSNAIARFICGEPTQTDLELVIVYLRYVIYAPCWERAPNYAADLAALRRAAWQLEPTFESIHAWIAQALEIGIDPL